MLREIVECAAQLVKLPSESSGFTDTDRLDPEGRVRAFLETYLARNGVVCSSHEVERGRRNLVARFPVPGAPRLLIAGHMDTVSGQGMDRPFAGEVAGGRLHGRGACDDKGPLAAALCSLVALGRQGGRLAYDVTLAGTVDEECTLAGARALAGQIAGWDLCIALEPTELRMITAHKGVCRFSVETTGKSVHSSRPAEGANAIVAMLPVLADLQSFSARLAGRIDPEMGPETLCVTMLRGGSSVNVVPDRCEAVVDVRLLPETDAGAFERRLSQVIGGRGILRGTFSARGMRTDPATPLVRAFRSALSACGHSPQPETAAFATDGSELGPHGPCIVWGPGSIAHAHSREEHIELNALQAAGRVLERFLTTPPAALPGYHDSIWFPSHAVL